MALVGKLAVTCYSLGAGPIPGAQGTASEVPPQRAIRMPV